MTKHEANAAMCRALGVEPKPITCGCYAMEVMCDCAIAYPDLTSADALMAALRKAGISACLTHTHATVSSRWTPPLPNETHGSMLFRAACAAFGIDPE